MDKGNSRENYREVISMEEYLRRRKRSRETEEKYQMGENTDKASAWFMAELYI